ncbi:glutamine synthetase [Moorella thermoacetica]|uniref:Glutamine synthetase n=1 Tax=Moorella thermoacetica (strain ATCC 39073 / JCM 9320) TaxID=264732 RepID=Q2RG53_MOOTA|nr:type I glutamate--ammonia ligase [Moorella thermoacetica]AKX95153.1 glutamine synthetase [Moorella thermoacetica]AKX97778.1 glutamine synthetase [Moorella thermoacetica]OIQ56609.1 glutamine synthetase [Moorella thermoacetica]QDA01597.1 Glutamine synthetase [Moorella thermoacetica]TYL09388.1 Glutamine synthetase [Moorella thermoacetica]
MSKTPGEVLEMARKNNIQMVDLKFIDLPGTWQHFSVPLDEFDEGAFTSGVGFDGSSIRGFKTINESDMILVPDPDTAFIDPFCDVPTLSLVCNVYDPMTGQNYNRDPRFVAKKAEAYLKETGIADTSYWGPEAEFFILDHVRFDQSQYAGYYFLDSDEGFWNSGVEMNGHPNLGYRPRYKEGYFPVPPTDTLQNLRTEMVLLLKQMGIAVEAHHHEVATAGQGEIDMKYAPLTRMADQLMMFKYVVKNVAIKHNKTATFMPKPVFQDNGSGMHVHQSLWKGNEPLFYDANGYAGLSELALYYIGGLLKHAPVLTAFCSPTTNSFKRLVPGFEAPVNLVYSQRNRSAAIRIPMYSSSPAAKRIEYRPPDPSCNPYLAFAALLMAGLDGIKNKIHPGEPLDKDIYDLPPEEAARVKSLPDSLEEAIAALEKDHEFLLQGGVFDEDLINAWIEYKQKREINQIKLRPHPYEFVLYYDV